MIAMKLAKILILAIGLMMPAAAASFANVNFISSAGHRIIAVNSQTGETSTITLTATGPSPSGVIPADESIFLTYDLPISRLHEIQVTIIGDSSPVGINGYGSFYAEQIGTVAEYQVGLIASDRYTIQIRFLADVTFAPGDTISIAGVRVDTTGLGMIVGAVVEVDFSNAEGEAVVTNGQDLEVAELAEPLTVSSPATPSIQFLANGEPLNDVATVTISELFTNAFETKITRTRILLSVANIPAGCAFVGISGISGTASAHYGGYGPTSNTRYIEIDHQNASILEQIQVGLQFDLLSAPDYAPSNATVTVTLWPPLECYPEDPPLRYGQRNLTATIPFGIEGVTSGRLLSVFNAVTTDPETEEAVFDTGVAIMNGSGTAGLPVCIGQYGTITVEMYPWDGSGPYSFTTSTTKRPGIGLDANGMLTPRGTWSVLVSQLLNYAKNAASQYIGDDFTGFIIFTTDFPNAEGVNYISDAVFSTQAQGYQMINLIERDVEDNEQYQIDWLFENARAPI
jgi:hypothetical protein